MGVRDKLHNWIDYPFDHYFLLKNKYTSFYNYHQLSRDIRRLYTPELLYLNDYYGHATAIKKYCGLKNNYQIKAAIEHGIAFETFWDAEYKNDLPAIFVQGERRKEEYRDILGINKDIYVIGSLIGYANSFLDKNEILDIKRINGKTLTVFPAHSSHHAKVDFETMDFVNEIERISGDFDTVQICMYWKDIVYGMHKFYEKKGWKIITAGHIYDPFFLERLKSILLTTDLSMSNGVGSFLCYSIHMDIPVYIFKQKMSFECDDQMIEKDIKEGIENSIAIELENIFSNYSQKISIEQKNMCKYLFGVGLNLSKEKLWELLQISEKKYIEYVKK